MITLKAWALRHGILPATARQKALRGGFQTAVKVGRDWLIDEDEPKVNLKTGPKSRRRTPPPRRQARPRPVHQTLRT